MKIIIEKSSRLLEQRHAHRTFLHSGSAYQKNGPKKHFWFGFNVCEKFHLLHRELKHNNNNNHCYILICVHFICVMSVHSSSFHFVLSFYTFTFFCRCGLFSLALSSVCFWNEFEGSRKINTKSIIFTMNWLSRRSNTHLSIRGLKIAHTDSYTFSHFDAQ